MSSSCYVGNAGSLSSAQLLNGPKDYTHKKKSHWFIEIYAKNSTALLDKRVRVFMSYIARVLVPLSVDRMSVTVLFEQYRTAETEQSKAGQRKKQEDPLSNIIAALARE